METINIEDIDDLPGISSDLNEDAEYVGQKKDEEDLLLTAQRYLNIFHQIHIFKDKKKREFDESLLKMPEKVRNTLLSLAGGRTLLEHIEELEQKRGKGGKVINLAKDKGHSTKDLSYKHSEMITPGLDANTLKEILNENNVMQMHTMEQFSKELSQTFLMAQKEMLQALTQNIKNTAPAAPQAVRPVAPRPAAPQTTPSVSLSKAPLKTEPEQPEKPAEIKKTTVTPPVKPANPQDLLKAIGNKLVAAAQGTKDNINNVLAQKKEQPIPAVVKSPASAPLYNEALSKIRNALQSSTAISAGEPKITKVSLEKNDNEESSIKNSNKETEEWEYVDESGNPIDLSDKNWQYVDEDGNPVT